MIPGGDYLGAVNFEGAMMKAHPKGWCAGIFLTTFKNKKGKDAHKTVERMAKSGIFSEIVVHLAPFDYDHKYPINKHERQLIFHARWLEGIPKAAGTKILISPFCEHAHPARVMKPLFQKLRAVAPSCPMVNSIYGGEVVEGVITEIHIPNSKQLPRKPKGEYIVAADGFGGNGEGDWPDSDTTRILNFYADARQFRWWNFRCNGKFGNKDDTPLNKRKFWPDEDYLRGHHATMRPREGSVTWPNTKLYKPFADDHGAGGKDNKAMCIMQGFGKGVKVFDTDGNVIDVMTDRNLPPHTGKPKGKRYYSGRYAYQLGDIAQKRTGSRLIRIEDSPLTDADLRSGLFK